MSYSEQGAMTRVHRARAWIVETMSVRSEAAGPMTDGGVTQELERRMALATPQDTTRGLFFNGALAAVRGFGGESLAQRCLAAAGEKRLVDFFNYPVSKFLKLSLAASQALGGQLGGFEATQRRLGMQATRDFFSSMAGRTLLLLASGDAVRVLDNLPSGYRTAVSYGERTVEMTGPRSARVVMKRDFMLPAYNEGVLLAVLEAVHAPNARVTARPVGPLDTEYELSWG
jgi:uncharacterized protein (TIGR02265 family)